MPYGDKCDKCGEPKEFFHYSLCLKIQSNRLIEGLNKMLLETPLDEVPETSLKYPNISKKGLDDIGVRTVKRILDEVKNSDQIENNRFRLLNVIIILDLYEGHDLVEDVDEFLQKIYPDHYQLFVNCTEFEKNLLIRLFLQDELMARKKIIDKDVNIIVEEVLKWRKLQKLLGEADNQIGW